MSAVDRERKRSGEVDTSADIDDGWQVVQAGQRKRLLQIQTLVFNCNFKKKHVFENERKFQHACKCVEDNNVGEMEVIGQQIEMERKEVNHILPEVSTMLNPNDIDNLQDDPLVRVLQYHHGGAIADIQTNDKYKGINFIRTRLHDGSVKHRAEIAVGYLYMSGTVFKHGCLDINHFKSILDDDSNYARSFPKTRAPKRGPGL